MRLITIILLLCVTFSNAQIPINGTGQAVTINAPGQPSSVNISAPALSEFFPSQSGDIDFTDNHFWFAHPGFYRSAGDYYQRNTLSYVEFQTEEIQITLKIIGNWSSPARILNQTYINIQVNGVQNQFVSLTADNVEEQKTIVLPAGLKLVRIINGYNAALTPFNQSVVYADATVNINGIITDTVFKIKRPTPPVNAKFYIGTSIPTGASSTNPTVTGYVALLRSMDNWDVGSLCWGGKTTQTTTDPLADSVAVMVDRMMNGSASNELFIDLGTNDYAIHNKTKAAFKADYQRMLDAIIALRPDITIYCISLLNRTDYDTGNSLGYTGDDFADAIEELCNDRSTTRFIYGKNLVSPANCPDGVHPNLAGHNEVHTNLKAAYDLLAKVRVIPLFDYARAIKLFPYKIAN